MLVLVSNSYYEGIIIKINLIVWHQLWYRGYRLLWKYSNKFLGRKNVIYGCHSREFLRETWISSQTPSPSNGLSSMPSTASTTMTSSKETSSTLAFLPSPTWQTQKHPPLFQRPQQWHCHRRLWHASLHPLLPTLLTTLPWLTAGLSSGLATLLLLRVGRARKAVADGTIKIRVHAPLKAPSKDLGRGHTIPSSKEPAHCKKKWKRAATGGWLGYIK